MIDASQLDALIRKVLIRQSELDATFVRNALSAYGTDLDKRTLDSVFETIGPNDAMMLFENHMNADDKDVSMTEENGKMTYYLSFKTNVMIYGLTGAMTAIKTCARLRSEVVRLQLQDMGIFIQKVENPVELHEFKNNVLWQRHDFEIWYACKFTIEPIDESLDIESIDFDLIALSSDYITKMVFDETQFDLSNYS